MERPLTASPKRKISPSLAVSQPQQHLAQLLLAVPRNAGDAQDLSRLDMEAHTTKAPGVGTIVGDYVPELHGCAVTVTLALGMCCERIRESPPLT